MVGEYTPAVLFKDLFKLPFLTLQAHVFALFCRRAESPVAAVAFEAKLDTLHLHAQLFQALAFGKLGFLVFKTNYTL